jgi:hypothetical protein
MAIAPTTEADAAGFTLEQERVLSKVLWRIVPFLLLCYIIAYLDRVNVGVAGLTMNKDLGLSPSEFGWNARATRLCGCPFADGTKFCRARKTCRSAHAPGTFFREARYLC